MDSPLCYLENSLSDEEHLRRLCEGTHTDPHAFLGLHPTPSGDKVIRLFRPGAPALHCEVFGAMMPLTLVDPRGLFALLVPPETESTDYCIYHTSGLLAEDPYAFYPTLGEVDMYLFAKGVHYELYRCLGARLCEHCGVKGVKFTVWAPNARRVSLVGDFNHWDGRVNPMRSMGSSGLYEIFIPGLMEGEKYKFEIKTAQGDLKIKADPFAYSSELRPNTASMVTNVDRHRWQDEQWMSERKPNKSQHAPMVIYEVHLGSWKRNEDGSFLNYRDLAHQLSDYCQKMGFTHIELLPISEHPLDESWGYQVTGFFAVTKRFGTPADFQYFVDHLHQNGIGVILDWVPGHFPQDDFGLALFDGTAIYEHADPRKGHHPHWQTCIFNFGRYEVANFLIANALFWLEVMHIDALRVDAVASMLYLDYGRNEGEWIPNQYGGRENLEAIEFLKHLNSVVHQRNPGALMIAEESTAFAGISHPVEHGGIGFDMKWSMGWMNDTLSYFEKNPLFRHYHHNHLTFYLLYAFTERFVLVLSHDEVVHGKKSLLSKMPGDAWQKFAGLRLLYSYMMCQPGKKLLFMGGEIGQWSEWYSQVSVEWDLLKFPSHHGLQDCVRQLNHFYLNEPSLWAYDFDWRGFEWVDFNDHKNSVICYLRKSDHEVLLCIHNFTPVYHAHYNIKINNVDQAVEVFNSDEERYGGSGKVNRHIDIVEDTQGNKVGLELALSPLATHILRLQFVPF